MKSTVRLIAICSCLFISSTVFAQANKILGVWLVEEGDAKVEIYQNKYDYYVGVIVQMDDLIDPDTGKERLDENNPDPEKRKQKILGSAIVKGFEYKDGKYVDGKVYDPKNGKTYKGKMWFEGDELKMRGYVGPFFRTQTWTRSSL